MLFLFSTIPLFIAKKAFLTDYEGGENPLLLNLFFFFLFLALLSFIGYLFWKRAKTKEFYTFCDDAALSQEEIGFLISYAKKFHVRTPSSIVSCRRNFDTFMLRVAHHHEHLKLSEEDLIHETGVLQAIRFKLGFFHQYKNKLLRSSLALPINHPITIFFHDAETNQRFNFHSHIIHNNDFFFGIAPPPPEIAREVFGRKKQSLQISFIRENDCCYYFESYIARIVTYPEPMWYLVHSNELVKSEKHKILNEQTTLLIKNDDQNNNNNSISILLRSLTKEEASFTTSEEHNSLPTPNSGLLTLEIDGSPELLRCTVTGSFYRQETKVYRIQFNHLEHSQRLQLSKHCRTLRELADTSIKEHHPINNDNPS